MMICLTSELMMLPKAAPITTATARAMTLPLKSNSLNSFQSDVFFGAGGAVLGDSMRHLLHRDVGRPDPCKFTQDQRGRPARSPARLVRLALVRRVFVLAISRLACVTMG